MIERQIKNTDTIPMSCVHHRTCNDEDNDDDDDDDAFFQLAPI